MMLKLDFTQTIKAIDEALVEAHEKLKKHQKQQVMAYLKKDGTVKESILKVETTKKEKGKNSLINLIGSEKLEMKDLNIQLETLIPLEETKPKEEIHNNDNNIENGEYTANIEIYFEGKIPNRTFTQVHTLLSRVY